MGNKASAPIGSRWRLKAETKGRVFYVLEKKPFGRIELAQEGHPVFSQTTMQELLSATWERLPGEAQLPPGYYSS